MKKPTTEARQDPNSKSKKSGSVFQLLSPDTVINLGESMLDAPFSNLFRPFNSYINRVFELEQRDSTRRIIKFYRPGRWTREAILEEHEFLRELSGQEIPVIAPLQLTNGSTLGVYKDIYFALFPKCGGRCLDEYSDDQWLELGRLLGRIHSVGAMHGADSRICMGPEDSARRQADGILASGLVPADLMADFSQTVEEILDEIRPLFNNIEMIRLHGDCHFANIIYRPQESFSLIDFDDMVIGPPVQDLWMLLPGLLDEAFVEVDLFLEGYETFRPFDRRTLLLIEPLRAMRYIHYLAWCVYQVVEDGETRVMDDFGTHTYWNREIKDLGDQLVRIRKSRKPIGNM
jgi:Ser/Thr protein kinase RdoA (MazF antagonist)